MKESDKEIEIGLYNLSYHIIITIAVNVYNKVIEIMLLYDITLIKSIHIPITQMIS